ncbi:MAG: sigma 54-interacting transcriptional regulator [Acidobacteria bacterium]|jgi:transcriptional regulator with GAF, ATPase, and Fis domain|nr:sigma 54-interacting transcriptional regulator [Acidobacteriota bacterium]
MRWNTETRYKMLLEITNAVVTRTNREDLFQALAKELRKHFAFDRMAINLYDAKTQSISYFAAAEGVQPGGVLMRHSRPLADGAIARMVVQSRQPTVIDDLGRYKDLSSIGAMVTAGLNATMAFPMLVRNRILGSIHFSFRTAPEHISELTEVLTDVSRQVAIAVDNMLAYAELEKLNRSLEREKDFLLQSSDDYQQDEFFFASAAMAEIIKTIRQSADTDATVLITGETGTGKDYLARCIHNLSPRRQHLFVKTNCPALASSLFESELFGHAKGAFTGASDKRVGRFELAHGGTIFLDEIAELPIGLQAKLLHILQDNQFERVGDSRPVPIDCRVIAATNKDLRESIRAGSFRQDLFYRLNIVSIHVPPLRERREDIPVLMTRLTQIQARQMNRPEPVYGPRALERLSAYPWPGNVRELKNLVKRLVILRAGDRISADDVEKMLESARPQGQMAAEEVATLRDSERRHIVRALARTRGVLGGEQGAAKLLALPRSTLQYRIKKLNIKPQDYLIYPPK